MAFDSIINHIQSHSTLLLSSLSVLVFSLLFYHISFTNKLSHIHPTSSPTALRKDKYQPFKLTQKTRVSHNTSLYRFALRKHSDLLGLPIGQHIFIQANINGKNIQRSYTPVSSDDDRGHFDLMIKTYDQGNISKHIAALKLGDEIYVKGPMGQMKYYSAWCNQIGMIAGGTGITPMLQIIRACAKDPDDTTRISLIYANVNQEDILLKDELDQIQKDHPDQFSIYYVLNNPPEGWTGGVGFVTKQMIEDHLPSPKSDSSKVLLCGPPPMISIMKKHLEELEFEKCKTISKMADQVFCF